MFPTFTRFGEALIIKTNAYTHHTGKNMFHEVCALFGNSLLIFQDGLKVGFLNEFSFG